jgi:hypothetical protein
MLNLKIVSKPSRIEGIKVVHNYNEVMEELKEDNPCCMFEDGMSMFPILFDREYCKLVPVKNAAKEVKNGDAVFCSISGHMMIHRVTDVVKDENKGTWFQIGTTQGDIFGWTPHECIYAVANSTGYIEE